VGGVWYWLPSPAMIGSQTAGLSGRCRAALCHLLILCTCHVCWLQNTKVSDPGKVKRKFSSFFKSLVIELDKDLYGPDNHLVEVTVVAVAIVTQ